MSPMSPAAIVTSYLAEAQGDAHAALDTLVRDALADLTELERRSNAVERVISHGYVRGVSVSEIAARRATKPDE